jgi:hypothetical protein
VFNVTTWYLAAIAAGIYLAYPNLDPMRRPGALLYAVVALGILALELLSLILRRLATTSLDKK